MGRQFPNEPFEAPLWALIDLAVVAAETYDRAENPGKYGEDGTMDALAKWFPRLRAALENAGMLK
jgi:hypothetical protein